MPEKEKHPLPFFLPQNAKFLMLGSFPPQQKRWSMAFFYPNFQNDMWRIFGYLFFGDKNHFVDVPAKKFRETAIREFLAEKGIALGDTATEVVRLKENASDKFLQIVKTIDLIDVFRQIPQCEAIVVTGQKALETILSLLDHPTEPKIGDYIEVHFQQRKIRLYRMPSSSRAYPLSLDKKAEYYKAMFHNEHLL
ncbi:MAG: uracil-DNA glycosylase family protein [Paludibacteraceae bacterium]